MINRDLVEFPGKRTEQILSILSISCCVLIEFIIFRSGQCYSTSAGYYITDI